MSGDQQRVTIEDVAQQAGVSIATVSRVMNGTGTVAATTAVRVHQAITDLNYIPHAAARGLARQRTQTLGLVLPQISDTFFSALLRGMETVAREHEYALLIYTMQGRNPNQPPPLGQHNTDGLMVFTDGLSEAALRHLHSQHFPLVLLHQSPPQGLDIPCVTFENKTGAYAVVSHLIGLGHRRIAFLAGPSGNEDSFWREKGYREAMADHDLVVAEELVGVGGFDEAVAATAVSQWLQQGLDIDAIFAADDESARGVMQAIQKANLRIPQDIALAGFDDSLLSRYLTPPLTTVHAPIEEAGRVATEKLIGLINDESVELLTLLPTELVIRRSCGANS